MVVYRVVLDSLQWILKWEFLTVWDIGILVNCVFYKLQGFKERKMKNFPPNTRADVLVSFYKF